MHILQMGRWPVLVHFIHKIFSGWLSGVANEHCKFRWCSSVSTSVHHISEMRKLLHQGKSCLCINLLALSLMLTLTCQFIRLNYVRCWSYSCCHQKELPNWAFSTQNWGKSFKGAELPFRHLNMGQIFWSTQLPAAPTMTLLASFKKNSATTRLSTCEKRSPYLGA